MRRTFGAWLKDQQERDDVVGELARDLKTDRRFAKLAGRATTKDVMKERPTEGGYWPLWIYLDQKYGGTDEGIKPFDLAWQESGRHRPDSEW